MTNHQHIPLLLASILLAGCSTTLPDYRFSTAQAEQAVKNWLDCDECSDDQLHHVVIIGKDAERLLQDYVDSPGRDFPATFRADLKAQHADMKQANPGLVISDDAWADVHIQARKNRVKARAARALHIINSGSMSRRELDGFRRVR